MSESLHDQYMKSIVIALGSMVSMVTFTMVYICVKKRRQQDNDVTTHLNFIYTK